MDNHHHPDDESLSISDLARIDRVCVAFEESCKSGQPATIERLLVEVPEPVQSALLRELLLLELDYRCGRDGGPVESEYVARFPAYEAVVGDVFQRLRSDGRAAADAPTIASGMAPIPPPSAMTELSPGEQLGDYTILMELGHGGFGTVYLARDENLQRQVAIKIPRRDRFKSREQKESFFKEARTAAQLKHDGIVPIYAVGRHTDEAPFVVMEYLEGESLETVLGSGQLSYRRIAELLVDVAEAVHHAHRKGIVHRDLKPSNIVFNANGRPCITDFGLSEQWDPNAATSPSHTAELAGTAQFIPPEVYAGTGVMGPSIDVYALGVMLYLALTGRLPFDGKNLNELSAQILAGVPPLPNEINPNVPEKLQRICLKAMEHPAHRYESAQWLADELRRYLEGREVLARPLRYDAELRGKLQNHYTEIHTWREQNLIDLPGMDRLLRPYWFLLQSDSPWPTLARTYPLEAITIRLGGWLVLLSTLLWHLYWPTLEPAPKITTIALPTLALNGVGWTFWYLQSKWNARIFLGIGALLLPLLVVVVLQECGLVTFPQQTSEELFARVAPNWAPSNVQLTLSSAAFLAYCVFLLRLFPGRLFAVWLAIGVYVFFTGCLALWGLREWLENSHVARALVCYLFPCLLLLLLSLWSDRLGHRGEAAMLFMFFPVPLAILLTLLGYYGSWEWLPNMTASSPPQHSNETVNLWWMSNGFVYAVAAVFSFRSKAGFVRFWNSFFASLVPLSLLLPCNILIGSAEVEPLNYQLGGVPVNIYELLGGVAAIGFVLLGTYMNRAALTVPGLLGLATFLFRFTDSHLKGQISWPVSIAIVGGVAMLAGVASAAVRARTRRAPPIPAVPPARTPDPPAW